MKCESLTTLYMTEDYLFAGSDNSVKMWDLATFEIRTVLQGHVGAVEAICGSTKYLFTGSADKDIQNEFHGQLESFHKRFDYS